MIRLTVAAALLAGAVPVLAQVPLEARVDRVERELRAVQRKVFPGGAPVAPEIDTQAGPSAPAGTAATPLVGDLAQRVESLEAALARLTGQVEQATFRLNQQDEAIKALQARMTPAPATTPGAAAAADGLPAATADAPAATPATSATPVPAAIDADRAARVASVEMPATRDAGEDAYSYGFRLYDAKLYPEAATALTRMIEQYPRHARISHARNLLGRAYLDDGKPGLAAQTLLANYKADARGARAAESLYWLGEALVRLDRRQQACDVYAEFGDVYGASAPRDLLQRVAKARADRRCGS